MTVHAVDVLVEHRHKGGSRHDFTVKWKSDGAKSITGWQVRRTTNGGKTWRESSRHIKTRGDTMSWAYGCYSSRVTKNLGQVQFQVRALGKSGPLGDYSEPVTALGKAIPEPPPFAEAEVPEGAIFNPDEPNDAVRGNFWDVVYGRVSVPEQGPTVYIELEGDCKLTGGKEMFRVTGPIAGNEDALGALTNLRDDHRYSGKPYTPECNAIVLVVGEEKPLLIPRADIHDVMGDGTHTRVHYGPDPLTGEQVAHRETIRSDTFRVSGFIRK